MCLILYWLIWAEDRLVLRTILDMGGYVRDMDPFTELYFLLQNPVGISYYKLIFSSYKNTKAVSLLFLCHLCLEIVLQDVYFRYAPQFHVSDSLSYSDTTF